MASFCASETAETGRIANGREQGDHVSRRQESFKGGAAANNSAKRKDLLRQQQKIMPPRAAERPRSGKEFNFVNAKPPLRRADSRFAEPRCSLQRERIVTFCIVQKVTKKHTGRSPATRDSNLRSICDFCVNDRRSSCNRLCRVLQGFLVSPVRI